MLSSTTPRWRQEMNTHAELRYPVSLILSCHWQRTAQWRYQQWQIVALLPQHTTPDSYTVSRRRVHTGEAGEHFLFSGLWLEFFRDGLQAYYQNLTGAKPSLFVLCHDDASSSQLTPIAISASHADAEGHMESDGIVLNTPLVAPYSTWLADYVLNNQLILDQQLHNQRQDKKGKRRHV
jgi:hypothetical protein